MFGYFFSNEATRSASCCFAASSAVGKRPATVMVTCLELALPLGELWPSELPEHADEQPDCQRTRAGQCGDLA
jgi:hypothetical protein